uniref:Uncharacterized protein n=1 Tax=Pseudomonas marincola TaxID=437900 RepID=A0A653E1H2_9PSED
MVVHAISPPKHDANVLFFNELRFGYVGVWGGVSMESSRLGGFRWVERSWRADGVGRVRCLSIFRFVVLQNYMFVSLGGII